MRPERTIQASIFDRFAEHEIGRELKAMSAWLDDHRELRGLVAADLRRHGVKQTGRHGLPAEAVLRCALLKQYRQLSYQELAFHLEDSASFRAFARLPWAWSPKKSVLHRTIGAIRAETWEAINRALLASAAEAKLEHGTMVRLDSTVTAALLHEPSDSSLLWDAVRVMTRLLKQAKSLGAGSAFTWRDHRRAAKKRARDIEYTRGRPRRAQLYRELLEITRATLAWLREAAVPLATATDPAAARWQARVRHHLPLIEQIDETWATTAMARRYGRARRGRRVVAAVPHGHWKTTTVLAALRQDGLTAPCVFDGAINGARFVAYIEQALAPTLRAVTLVEIPTTSSDTSGRTAATRSSPHGKHLV